MSSAFVRYVPLRTAIAARVARSVSVAWRVDSAVLTRVCAGSLPVTVSPLGVPCRFASKRKSSPAASAAPKAASSESSDEATDVREAQEAAAGSSQDVTALMRKHVDYAKRELDKLRGATANPAMLDHVRVEAYGEMQPLTAVAQVALKNPQLLVVNPFDAALAPAIADAIRDAELNLNPAVDGNVVRVPIPKTSKETRETTVKTVSKIAEAAKTRIRRVRQAALDKLKKLENVSADDIYNRMKEVQAMTTSATEDVAKLAEKKRLEIEAS